MEINGNIFVCKSLKLAGFLAYHGCPIKSINTNAQDPSKKVFLFRNTSVVQELVDEYKKQKQKQENKLNKED